MSDYYTPCESCGAVGEAGTTCEECGGRGCHARLEHLEEFPPEFHIEPAIVDALLAAGFDDISWHNDICPSFERACTFCDRPNGDTVRIWIDAANPRDREFIESDGRFNVALYSDGMELVGDMFPTDSIETALEVAHEILAGAEKA